MYIHGRPPGIGVREWWAMARLFYCIAHHSLTACLTLPPFQRSYFLLEAENVVKA